MDNESFKPIVLKYTEKGGIVGATAKEIYEIADDYDIDVDIPYQGTVAQRFWFDDALKHMCGCLTDSDESNRLYWADQWCKEQNIPYNLGKFLLLSFLEAVGVND